MTQYVMKEEGGGGGISLFFAKHFGHPRFRVQAATPLLNHIAIPSEVKHTIVWRTFPLPTASLLGRPSTRI